MSSRCPEIISGPEASRRACLRWGAASLSLAALSWTSRSAGCPCDEEERPAPAAAPAPAQSSASIIRVCADPNNLPFSNRNREGFEDKIAELIARDLGLTLQYEYLPQRLGFYRVALKGSDCNLVMAAPAGFERALTTDPYYRSTYVFVYRKADGPKVTSFDDEALRTARIGVPLTGGNSNTPPTHALSKRGLIDNVTGYPAFDETTGGPGERIITAVADSEIDVAVAWGPQAGYFAREVGKRKSVALEVVPVSPAEDMQGDVRLPFTYDICMALRRSDKDLRDRINKILAARQKEIGTILDAYGVPRLPVRVAAPKHDDDDDKGAPKHRT